MLTGLCVAGKSQQNEPASRSASAAAPDPAADESRHAEPAARSASGSESTSAADESERDRSSLKATLSSAAATSEAAKPSPKTDDDGWVPKTPEEREYAELHSESGMVPASNSALNERHDAEAAEVSALAADDRQHSRSTAESALDPASSTANQEREEPRISVPGGNNQDSSPSDLSPTPASSSESGGHETSQSSYESAGGHALRTPADREHAELICNSATVSASDLPLHGNRRAEPNTAQAAPELVTAQSQRAAAAPGAASGAASDSAADSRKHAKVMVESAIATALNTATEQSHQATAESASVATSDSAASDSAEEEAEHAESAVKPASDPEADSAKADKENTKPASETASSSAAKDQREHAMSKPESILAIESTNSATCQATKSVDPPLHLSTAQVTDAIDSELHPEFDKLAPAMSTSQAVNSTQPTAELPGLKPAAQALNNQSSPQASESTQNYTLSGLTQGLKDMTKGFGLGDLTQYADSSLAKDLDGSTHVNQPNDAVGTADAESQKPTESSQLSSPQQDESLPVADLEDLHGETTETIGSDQKYAPILSHPAEDAETAEKKAQPSEETQVTQSHVVSHMHESFSLADRAET